MTDLALVVALMGFSSASARSTSVVANGSRARTTPLTPMTENVIALTVSVLLMTYLVVALLLPEKF